MHNGSYYPSISQNGIGGVGGGSAAHPSWLSRAEGRVGALEGRMAEMNGKLTEGSGGASNGKAAAGDGTASGGGGGGGLSTEAEVAAAGAAGPFTSGSGERLQPVLASLMAQEQNLGQGQGQGAHTPPATAEGSDTLPGKARARTTLPQELEGGCKGMRATACVHRADPEGSGPHQGLLAGCVLYAWEPCSRRMLYPVPAYGASTSVASQRSERGRSPTGL